MKELYGLENEVTFRNVTVSYENRPRPLHLGTATQIGQFNSSKFSFPPKNKNNNLKFSYMISHLILRNVM